VRELIADDEVLECMVEAVQVVCRELVLQLEEIDRMILAAVRAEQARAPRVTPLDSSLTAVIALAAALALAPSGLELAGPRQASAHSGRLDALDWGWIDCAFPPLRGMKCVDA